jgi:hypothetical protein
MHNVELVQANSGRRVPHIAENESGSAPFDLFCSLGSFDPIRSHADMVTFWEVWNLDK